MNTTIKQKPKPCNGTGIAKGYGCRKPTLNRILGLCQTCYPEWLLNTPEGQTRMKAYTLKGSTKVKRENTITAKRTHAQAVIKSKSIASLILDARAPFQKLIRIRDYRKKCISCSSILPFDIGAYHGGHYLKAELYRGLIFHPDNVHGQCIQCNKFFGGNEANYIEPLKLRIGIERYNKLINLKPTHKTHDWDRHQLIELKKYYQYQLKQVESGELNINDVDFKIGIP